jgi:hypothetical protein
MTTLGRKIDEGHLSNGLYVIDLNSTVLTMTQPTKVAPHIWHQQLGHPSDRVL